MLKNKNDMSFAHLLLAFQICAHAGLIYFVFTGKWWQFLICFFVYFLNGCLGMTMTYHRYLSHGSFKASSWQRNLGVLFATIGMTGSALSWVAIHREHHQFTDTERDPHSPKFKGWFRAHYLSMYSPVRLKYVTDLLRDRFLLFQHKHYFKIVLFYMLMLAAFDPSAVIYACLAPAAILWNAGSLIVSTSHRDGQPHNDLFFALLVWGEGNHTNHHLKPKAARFGKVDLGGWLIEKIF